MDSCDEGWHSCDEVAASPFRPVGASARKQQKQTAEKAPVAHSLDKENEDQAALARLLQRVKTPRHSMHDSPHSSEKKQRKALFQSAQLGAQLESSEHEHTAQGDKQLKFTETSERTEMDVQPAVGSGAEQEEEEELTALTVATEDVDVCMQEGSSKSATPAAERSTEPAADLEDSTMADAVQQAAEDEEDVQEEEGRIDNSLCIVGTACDPLNHSGLLEAAAAYSGSPVLDAAELLLTAEAEAAAAAAAAVSAPLSSSSGAKAEARQQPVAAPASAPAAAAVAAARGRESVRGGASPALMSATPGGSERGYAFGRGPVRGSSSSAQRSNQRSNETAGGARSRARSASATSSSSSAAAGCVASLNAPTASSAARLRDRSVDSGTPSLCIFLLFSAVTSLTVCDQDAVIVFRKSAGSYPQPPCLQLG
jgi:hypothetical protein